MNYNTLMYTRVQRGVCCVCSSPPFLKYLHDWGGRAHVCFLSCMTAHHRSPAAACSNHARRGGRLLLTLSAHSARRSRKIIETNSSSQVVRASKQTYFSRAHNTYMQALEARVLGIRPARAHRLLIGCSSLGCGSGSYFPVLSLFPDCRHSTSRGDCLAQGCSANLIAIFAAPKYRFICLLILLHARTSAVSASLIPIV